MFKKEKWTFTGATGKEYVFTISSKSEGLLSTPGVFIQAYTHLRGHMAGWQVNPLHLAHSENMGAALDASELSDDDVALWNCNYVLMNGDEAAREEVVRDLRGVDHFIC
ncbi:hypothetical protein [Pseudodesulfovibrio sp. zrk46]|uniref:hypothetical protein n=1 Tax=Pseudodesulfovibrio sp. zrk46 TaxID=2725288 RepID=UPI001448F5C7|nr:hypothetical protein [Pseudodesulfovibrio sp. zrk46]QJB55609.1 hypothetical protein HFN16_04005 [Pseudodesulfovibrio sp. zrk46]